MKDPEAPCTEPQQNFLRKLIVERDMTDYDPVKREWLKNPDNIPRLTKAQASTAIGELLKLDAPSQPAQPTQATQPSSESKVGKGRYFIVDPTDNVEKFIKVDKPEPPSRWAGRTFVSVQASDDFYPIKNPTHREAILATIAEDPINSMNEYGIRLGVCGSCGRTLTQIDSRLRGLGPVCAERILGVPSAEEATVLSQLGLI